MGNGWKMENRIKHELDSAEKPEANYKRTDCEQEPEEKGRAEVVMEEEKHSSSDAPKELSVYI